MLVDLARNDIGRVSEFGSVEVSDYMTIERYSHVMHIVSQVQGQLAANKTAYDLMKATFPAGTLSGAPKVRALQIISELENSRRGLYGGALGYFSYKGNHDSCIGIRTAVIQNQLIYIQSGAGVVADSVPEEEYIETLNKAKAMFKAVSIAEQMYRSEYARPEPAEQCMCSDHTMGTYPVLSVFFCLCDSFIAYEQIRFKKRNALQQPHYNRAIPRGTVDAVDENPYTSLHRNDRDAMFCYMQSISKTPLLTPQEEIDLASKIKKGNAEARERMIASNLRLVVKIARDYMNFGLPLMDLVSEGNIGLVKAVERFDPYKGGKLSTYASWWIKQSIKRALANHSKTIRVPVHLVDRISKMRKIIQELSDEIGRVPSDEEIGYAMGIHQQDCSPQVHQRSATPLDAPVNEESETSFGDLVGDENQSSPFEDLDTKMQSLDIKSVLSELSQRSRDY